ncbi:PREDICTED: UBP1-associated protein 2A-like [Rhagoletis zephyria]|uniref:UBP1-associated protein 2A-like n=1 Tax=Rhagoletis zephyria TaxID=28612 RepID=UPI0008112E90|nr:PREDICTED: UBP1-associated protein 2A-like [Rhagoletis zephyria]
MENTPIKEEEEALLNKEETLPSDGDKIDIKMEDTVLEQHSPKPVGFCSSSTSETQVKAEVEAEAEAMSIANVSINAKSALAVDPTKAIYFGCRDNVGRNDPPANRCLGIFGLSMQTKEIDIRNVFSTYGQIEDLQIVHDSHTGRSRGFAFIYFKDKADAETANLQSI